MAIDQAEFRRVLGHFASGVTVVTACQAGICHGITVSSFASLSLEPPLVLFCIDQHSSCHDAIANADGWVINILAEDGEWLSRLFAGRDPDKFAKVRYRLGLVEAPILDDALAVIECRLHSQLPGGDHTIFVGEVVAMDVRRNAKPLLYFRSGYGQLA
ncbi:MAG: flavin reductase family protein [Chloroflexota bacterium]|nr:flavin reductase family protein [Chloroflexota bacterium]PLS77066.1 MAG: flavin reductase [Chloroflexota bacterium]